MDPDAFNSDTKNNLDTGGCEETIRNFVFKTRNIFFKISKTRNFVLKTRNFILKMSNVCRCPDYLWLPYGYNS